MIHSFKVENFYSINEEQELNFTSNKKYSGSYGNYNDKFINLVNCFVGANASGKTNVFKALSFLIWFSENSFYNKNEDNENLFSPHQLRKNEPTKFEIIFDIKNRLYKYSISLTPKELLSEELEIKSQKGFTYLYKLENVNNEISIKYNRYSDILPKINPKEENRFKTKRNATFFSFLTGIGYLDDVGLSGMATKKFFNVHRSGSVSFDSNIESIFLSKEFEKPELKSEILPYIKDFDFGIEDYANENYKLRIDDEIINLIGFKHTYNGQTFSLPILEESAGTVKGMYLAVKLLNVLKEGGIAIIDELDARLHYEIARKLISLFADKNINTKNAQLLFSTHQPLFLNDRDKAQIFLCYKEDYINTEVYRLDEVEGVRNTENFFEKYLSGEYGAIPRIGGCV